MSAFASGAAPSLDCLRSGLQGISPPSPSSADAVEVVVAYWPICGHLSCVAPATHMAATTTASGNTVHLDFYVGLAPIVLPGAVRVDVPVPNLLSRITAGTAGPLAPGTHSVVAQVHALDSASGSAVSSCPSSTFAFRVSEQPGAAPAPVQVVEYYHAAMDHYFATADPGEIAALDAGAFAGWQRTGEGWTAFAAGRSGGQGVAVCRYVHFPPSGIYSHFFSANVDECDVMRGLVGSDWTLETGNAWESGLPGLVDGQCPAGSTRIHRFWNGRADANHRYVTTQALRQEMLSRGWIQEGWGSDPAAMCSAP